MLNTIIKQLHSSDSQHTCSDQVLKKLISTVPKELEKTLLKSPLSRETALDIVQQLDQLNHILYNNLGVNLSDKKDTFVLYFLLCNQILSELKDRDLAQSQARVTLVHQAKERFLSILNKKHRHLLSCKEVLEGINGFIAKFDSHKSFDLDTLGALYNTICIKKVIHNIKEISSIREEILKSSGLEDMFLIRVNAIKTGDYVTDRANSSLVGGFLFNDLKDLYLVTNASEQELKKVNDKIIFISKQERSMFDGSIGFINLSTSTATEFLDRCLMLCSTQVQDVFFNILYQHQASSIDAVDYLKQYYTRLNIEQIQVIKLNPTYQLLINRFQNASTVLDHIEDLKSQQAILDKEMEVGQINNTKTFKV